MLYLNRLVVKNIAQWRYGEIDLSRQGVTFVRGRNDDNGGTANGSGKSSFFNSLFMLTQGDHQLAAKKRSVKTLVRKESFIGLSGRREDAPFTLKMKQDKLSVSLNRKEVEARTKDHARNIANTKIIGMPRELWASMVHVNGIANNPLIRGTSAQRCSFIESAFELDRWASRYKSARDALASMKRAVSDLDDAKRELSDMPKSVNISKMDKSIELKSRIVKQLNNLQSSLEEAVAPYRNAPAKPRENEKHYKRIVRELEARMEEVEKSAERLADWKSAKEKQKEQLELRAELLDDVAQAKKLLGKYDKQSIEAWRRKLRELERSAEDTREAIKYRDVVIEFERLAKTVAKRHGIVFKDLSSLVSLARGWIDNLKGGDTSCPICGSRLRHRVDEKDLTRLQKLLERMPDRVFDPRAIDTRAIERLHKFRDLITAAEKIEEAERRLATLVIKKLPSPPNATSASTIKLARKLAVAKELARRANLWGDTKPEAIEAFTKKLENLPRRLETVRDKLSALKERRARAEETNKARKAIEDRIARLEKEIALHPVYKALSDAYSPSGIRLWMLSEMLEAIVSSLNSFASASRERMVYGYKLSRNRELTLTITNLTDTFDVRFLSGGEAGAFCISLIASILPLLPERKRCSTLILDEVDANADYKTRQVISNDYLPRLAEVVPSVFVITPMQKSDFYMSGSNELLVVKKKGVSTFI